MTLEEAFRELGVDLSANADVARRAYLKLIKVRRPETDPDGFQRAREAYEKIRARVSVAEGAFATPLGARPAAVEPPPPPPPTPMATGAAAPAGPAPAPMEPPTEERFRAEFAALPPNAPLDAPLGIARRARAALPRSVTALRWLVRALVSVEKYDEAIQALRGASDLREALWELALLFPGALTEEELPRFAAEAPVPLLWATVDALFQIDQGQRAATLTLLAFDAQKREPETPPPPPDWLGLLVLRLHESGQPAAARRVCDRYEQWLRDEDLFQTFLKDPVGRVWPLVRELGLLPDDLSRLVRAPLARAISEDAQALPEAFSRLKEYDPALAAAAAQTIRAKAPQLAQAFAHALERLEPPKPPVAVVRSFGRELGQAALVPAILFGLVFIGWGIFKVVELVEHHAAPTTPAEFAADAARRVKEACDPHPTSAQPLCDTMKRYADELTKPNCGAANRSYEEISSALVAFERSAIQDDPEFAYRARETFNYLHPYVAWMKCEVR